MRSSWIRRIALISILAIFCGADPASADTVPSLFADGPEQTKAPRARPARAKAQQAAPSPEYNKACEFLERLGLKEQLENLPRLIEATPAQNTKSTNAPPVALVKETARKAFAPAKLIAIVCSHVARTLSAEDQAATLLFAESESGSRVIARTKQMYTVDGMKELRAFASAAKSATPSWATQTALYTEIAEATGNARNWASMPSIAANAMARGLTKAGFLQDEQRATYMQTVKKAAEAALRKDNLTALVAIAYVGAGVPESDMQQWLTFLKSDAGRRFYESANAGIRNATAAAFQEFAPALVRAMAASQG